MQAAGAPDAEAAEYLAAAQRLLRERLTRADGLWPRACAWLLRLALEAALRGLWQREGASTARATMRVQLLCLRSLEGSDHSVSIQATYLWAALSNACHYHPYELSPTMSELRTWHADVTDVTTRLHARAMPAE
jgi:hypothetical protein